jgi:hypothetical protein
VQTLCNSCFKKCIRHIQAFSDLCEIEEGVFSDCPLLESLCIPASVTTIGCSALLRTNLSKITVDSHNSHFCVLDNFLMDFEKPLLIRSIDIHPFTVTIFRDMDFFRRYCFADSLVRRLDFECGSKVREITRAAFSDITALRSIRIPASVEMLHGYCFSKCISLSDVTFEQGSRLQRIDKCAFSQCRSIPVVCIPSSVESIGKFAFSGCITLSTKVFDADSKLQRIDEGAFSGKLVRETALNSLVLSLNRDRNFVASKNRRFRNVRRLRLSIFLLLLKFCRSAALRTHDCIVRARLEASSNRKMCIRWMLDSVSFDSRIRTHSLCSVFCELQGSLIQQIEEWTFSGCE